MATNKECDCVYQAVNLMLWADKLSNDGRIEKHYGDVNIKDSTKVPIVVPGILKSKVNKLSEMIHREAIEVKNAEKEFRNTCDISALEKTPINLYKEGMNDLQIAIERKGKDPDAAMIAGSKITDAVFDAISSKKLIKCKD